MANKKISFNIDEDVHLKIKELSFRKHKTLTELYQKYIYEGLKKDLEEMDSEEEGFVKTEMIQKKLNDYGF